MSVSISVEKSEFNTTAKRIVLKKDNKEMSILLSENATWIESIGMFQEDKKAIFRNNVERENVQDILEWFMK